MSIKKRLLCSILIGTSCFGIYALLLYIYCLFSHPDTLTWYEDLMTIIVALFLNSWIVNKIVENFDVESKENEDA